MHVMKVLFWMIFALRTVGYHQACMSESRWYVLIPSKPYCDLRSGLVLGHTSKLSLVLEQATKTRQSV